jgi:PDZ domain
MSSRIVPLLCLLTAAVTSAHGAGPERSGEVVSNAQTEQRLRQDVQLMLSRLAASGALGEHPEQLDLRLDEPAQRVTNLGILVDSTSAERARDGLRVLGATPGSTAEHLGLRPGDVIVAVNDTSLRDLGADAAGHALAAATLKASVDSLPDSAPLRLQVVRAGDTLALNAPLQSVYLPALRMELGVAALANSDSPGGARAATGTGCGRISTFDVAPRSDHQYHARILLLDGVSPGPSGGEVYRVAAGEHRLLVAENIPTRQMGVGEIASLRRNTSKEFTVIVKPGTTAMVAAQLHPDKASDLAHGGYWDPVVWRESPETCP